ncbi:MAG: hypothetical protein HQ546_04190 [Planctomycetes bacterium]|nr:hypothetical protein [Planctomycetota bacterium]
MPQAYGRFSWLIRLAKLATVLSLVVLALALVVTIATGVLELSGQADAIKLALYTLAFLAELAAAVGVVVAYGLMQVWADNYAAMVTLNGHVSRLESVLSASENHQKRLVELAALSDQAKTMIYRERELDAVQEIINDCLLRQDYVQAEKLIDRMTNLGYQAEAERIRTAVSASRRASDEEKTNAAIERVNQIIAEKNWDRAMRETQRLLQAFPMNQAVNELTKKTDQARSRHKSQLLHQYDEAVKRNDVDGSIKLLRELDRYLSPQEAAAMSESARGVFRAKLHNLGVQFAIAVNEDQWNLAVKTGEQIVQDYPNSRMAMEVRRKLDTLRQIAATAQG